MDTVLLDAFTRLLAGACTPATLRAAEAGDACAQLDGEIAEAGFLDAMLPEEAGGAGLTLAEVFPLVLACGEHLVPLPFAETMVARAMLYAQGASLPAAARVVLAAPGPLLPQSGGATHALLRQGGSTVLLPLREADSLFGLPLRRPDTDAEALLRIDATGPALDTCAAAITAGLMAGAMKRVLAMTLTYAGQREQFGRPIGRFQAVQQQVAVLAEHVLSAEVAARIAFDPRGFTVTRSAMAKTCANEAAQAVCDIAHAVHGAIGVTAEYDLQLYTRRLKHWQLAFGGESHWARMLAAAYLDGPRRCTVDFLRNELDAPAEPGA